MNKTKVFNIVKNRFVITSFLFIIWLVFIDHNNVIDRIKSKQENKKLEEIKTEYIHKIKETNEAMKALDNKEHLEKLAREKYLMKKENEDIFIVTE